MKIAIIGAGEIGSVLALELSRSNQVGVWDRNPKKTTKYKSLEKLLPASELAIFCVPSWALPEVLKKCKPFLKKKLVAAAISKGMEPDGSLPYETLKKYFTDDKFAIIAGPMLAEEIRAGKSGLGVAASMDTKAAKFVAKAFTGSRVKFEVTNDVRGVAVTAVLKNIYSLALGMADCLRLGNNVKGWMVNKIYSEMRYIVGKMNGRLETADGLAGLGDLIATGFSSYSKNHAAGQELVRFGYCKIASEGLVSIKPMANKMRNHLNNLALLHVLNNIVTDKRDARQAILDYIKKNS
jgi:glycerol-3-phosphate dehydrogenase (NAD(P)+)